MKPFLLRLLGRAPAALAPAPALGPDRGAKIQVVAGPTPHSATSRSALATEAAASGCDASADAIAV